MPLHKNPIHTPVRGGGLVRAQTAQGAGLSAAGAAGRPENCTVNCDLL